MLPALGSLESSRRDRDIQTGLYHRGRHTVPRAGGREESKWLCLAESRKAPEKGDICQSSKREKKFTKERRKEGTGNEGRGRGRRGKGREKKGREGRKNIVSVSPV